LGAAFHGHKQFQGPPPKSRFENSPKQWFLPFFYIKNVLFIEKTVDWGPELLQKTSFLPVENVLFIEKTVDGSPETY